MKAIKTQMIVFLVWVAGIVVGGIHAEAMVDASLSMEFLALDIPVKIASQIEQPLVKAPGIVSIITKQEIKNMGARDLDDLLFFIPGMVPGAELQGNKGYGIRGLWALEGKMLILTDGIPMNETHYGNSIFAGQYCVDNIERIEVIRGPGSAMYGGYAELGVVNIITRNTNLNGGAVSVSYGQWPDSYARKIVSVNYGNRFDKLGVTVSGALNNSLLGDGEFVTTNERAYPMTEFGGQRSWKANIGLDYENFYLGFIANDLEQDFPADLPASSDGVTEDPKEKLTTIFKSYNLDAKYIWQAFDELTITPKVLYSFHDTWHNDTAPAIPTEWYQIFPSAQFKAGLTAAYTFTPGMTLVLGSEYRHDYIWSRQSQEAIDSFPPGFFNFFVTNTQEVDNYTNSYFGEFNAQTPYVDLTVGMRYDQNSQFSGAGVPRIALTKEFGAFNAKLLASRAFREPTLMELYWFTPELKPEFATVYEGELGYRFTPDMLLKLNVFDMNLDHAIIYTADNQFINGATAGSRGIEAEYRLNQEWGYLSATYSYYQVYNNTIEGTMAMDAQGNPLENVTLGFPTHKATLNSSVKIIDGLALNPSLIYLSQRYVQYMNVDEDIFYRVLDPVTLVNLTLRQVLLQNSLEVNLSVFNILNQSYVVAPGYYSGFQPNPGPAREVVLKMIYHF